MKQYYILLVALVFFSFTQAQIVNIPDAIFKNVLVNDNIADFDGDGTFDGDVDTNDDGEIQVSEAQNVKKINVASKNITSLEGIQSFSNLETLLCNNNQLTSIDISQNIILTDLICDNNQLTNLDVSQNVTLVGLNCSYNQLTNLNINENLSLSILSCSNNQLTNVDVSQNTSLTYLGCNDNNLHILNLKNGNTNQLVNLNSTSNSNLYCIEVDDVVYANTQVGNANWVKDNGASFNSVSCNDLSIIFIPDVNFKYTLVNDQHIDVDNDDWPDIDVDINNDGEIQITEALSIDKLFVRSKNIASLEGIQYFTNLISLYLGHNQLTNLDISQNVNILFLECYYNDLTELIIGQNSNIYKLECQNNQLTSLDISQNLSIKDLVCSSNQLTSLNLTQHVNLETLNCKVNNITSLDLSNNVALNELQCSGNQLTELNMKNGSYEVHPQILYGNTDLNFVCVDNEDYEMMQVQVNNLGYTNCIISTYCSFVPGGDYYSVDGISKLDSNNNGCDVSDPVYSNLKFNIAGGTEVGSFIANNTGLYNIPVQQGSHTITPQLENPTYFNISPTSLVVAFPADISPFNQDFCITPNGVHNDLEITVLPVTEARPGFDSDYKLVYKNKGNVVLSGNVSFVFNDDIMDFVSATSVADTQNTGSLTWNYTNLQPFETRTIDFTMNINTPTDPSFPVNGSDVLDYTATINPFAGDETPLDNVSELYQTVVNAYDPNDKTCLEGKTISPSEVGEYVHYLVRFENNGTANAVNIVVKDVIDVTKYDVSTLIPLHGSHSYVTRVRDTNIVEFIFENINLPFDNANNDGYVAFKIKTQPTLVLNDTFENNAEIYFDYNAPIITNVAQTTVAILGLADYSLDRSIGIYPNPAKGIVYIQGKHNLKEITVFDVNGRVLSSTSVIGTQLEKELDITKLIEGIYFVRVVSSKGQFVSKLIKE